MSCTLTLLQVGDGTNFVLMLAGTMLELAEDLLRMGLSPAEVIEGYKMSAKKALEILPSKWQCSGVWVCTCVYIICVHVCLTLCTCTGV